MISREGVIEAKKNGFLELHIVITNTYPLAILISASFCINRSFGFSMEPGSSSSSVQGLTTAWENFRLTEED